MGMSASQARYTMLSGKKSDVEFQGQQINQERTTLATESASLSSQLLDVSVPTPPSSSDYSTTTYSYESNGETYTVAGTQYKSSAYTDSDGKSYSAGSYIVTSTTDETVSEGKSSGTTVFTKTVDSSSGSTTTTYMTNTGTVLSLAGSSSDATENATDTSNIAQICQDCGIEDANGNSYGSANYTTPTFYKYETSSGTYKYVEASTLASDANEIDVNSSGTSSTVSTSNTGISTYYVDDDSSETVTSQMYGASVTWDEDGRMTSVTDADGNTYSLSCTSTSDESAYDDAMNDYEYQKSLYDQNMTSINAKIDVIQTDDKKLELKLQNLDTQQQALSTEMDSVKKVIDKNIESSFKAFNA